MKPEQELEPSQVTKRGVSINHHRTSVSLEQPFWQHIKQIAERTGVSINELLGTIDDERKHYNLSSSLRVIVLQDCQTQIEELTKTVAALEAELERNRGSIDSCRNNLPVL